MALRKIVKAGEFVYNLFGRWLLIIFLFSLFLAKATPFYYLPFTSKLFSTHTLGKGLLAGLFVVIMIARFENISRLIKKNIIVFTLVGIFFLAQSLSVVVAADITFFWRSYHNLIVAMFIFFLSYYFSSKRNNLRIISKFVLVTGGILISYELIFFLFPEFVLPILQGLVQKEVLDAYYTNISRARYSLDMNTELFLPVFLVWGAYPTKRKRVHLRVVFFILSATLIFISFLSNFRSRVLMSLAGIFGFLFVYLLNRLKTKKFFDLKKVVVTALVVVISVYAAVFTSNRLFSFNVFDRFLLQDKREDVETVGFRLSAADKSLEMYKASPFFGVGLGNYAVYSKKPNFALQRFYYLSSYKEEYSKRVSLSPHNVVFQILSETGSVGAIVFGALMLHFGFKDIKFLLKKGSNKLQGYVLSFWVIVLFMLFNPASTIFMIGWFWFFRGLIEASYYFSLEA